jgi:DNA topoisomerase-1
MNLVVVESPSKAKTINKYLGKDYHVISSFGHIIDLPKSKIGVDIEKTFEPQYETIKGKEKVIKQLRSEAKKADKILLATDPDREGEAISWHISNVLKSTKKPLERIVFHEITKPAVIAAIEKPRQLDLNLVNAQQARRVLDRLVGYKLSPLLWKKIRFGLSAGRVQSVALRLIVDRELERQAFKAKEYWTVSILPASNQTDPKAEIIKSADENKPKFEESDFILELKKVNGKIVKKPVDDNDSDSNTTKQSKEERYHIINSEKEFLELFNFIKQNSIKVDDLKIKQVTKRPLPPFTTSTFQQSAVNTLGMTSKSAMRSAQKLYEAGLITYMRTDSLYFSEIAIQNARKEISSTYGAKYLPEKPNYYKNPSKSAQEAHEAIRPTDFSVIEIPKNMSASEQKVYNLIYRRALASQMSPAQFTQKTIIASSSAITPTSDINALEFSATAQKCDFDGWMKLYKINENHQLLKTIESIEKGSYINPKTVYGYEHFTQPPARYTEASLIKALEKFGIGRPSTYATIMNVIQQRDYVEKDGKYFFPTDTGFVVIKLLKQHFSQIVDIDFTANMETDLDHIATGKIDWKPMIKEFFIPFEKNISIKDKEINKEDLVILGESTVKCPECGKKMQKKLGKYGPFLSCSDFPKCKGMLSIEEDPEEAKKLGDKITSKEDLLKDHKPAPKTEDGRDFLLKKGRFGQFWAHPDYPKVKDARPLEFTDEYLLKTYGKAPKASDGKKMVLRKGKYGFFWAHPDYPEVKELQKAKKLQK